jgi:hypothetical protein
MKLCILAALWVVGVFAVLVAWAPFWTWLYATVWVGAHYVLGVPLLLAVLWIVFIEPAVGWVRRQV